jgi:hypothetical protein
MIFILSNLLLRTFTNSEKDRSWSIDPLNINDSAVERGIKPHQVEKGKNIFNFTC